MKNSMRNICTCTQIWNIISVLTKTNPNPISFLSRVSKLTRDIDIAILSVCLSVRPSVTRWYCMKTA